MIKKLIITLTSSLFFLFIIWTIQNYVLHGEELSHYTINLIQWLEQLKNSSLALDTQNIINNIATKWNECTNNTKLQENIDIINAFNPTSFISYLTAPIYILRIIIYGLQAFLTFFYWFIYYIFIFMINILKFIYTIIYNVLNPPFRYIC